MISRRYRRPLWIAALLVISALVRLAMDERPAVPRAFEPAESGQSGTEHSTIEDLFAQRQSGVLVRDTGRVDRTLADDNEGSRHQRFILRLDSGHTVLVAHNIDLAPRVPLQRGDDVEIQGDFEWNERGGVVHWTHHDPRGSREGGFIRHKGKDYR